MNNENKTIESLYEAFQQFPSIQTDTRKLKQNDLFFALKGDNFNGNLFAKDALEKGASFVIVDENINIASSKVINVTNVLTTLQLLAKYHREQLGIPIIAITGSNGKTTTKELVNAVLSAHYKTATTKGNLNNHIGVPLSLLDIKPDTEIAVIEMGANHQKEIEGYCKYCLPSHGLITNCGKAHLEGFGGVEGVRKGKGELFDFLRYKNGTAFINSDYDYFDEMSVGIKNIIKYGTSSGDVVGNILSNEMFLDVSIKDNEILSVIKTQLVGDYNLPNVLAAVAIGKYFNVPDTKIRFAIENYSPSNSRSQLIKIGTNSIILDAYNANPTSMKAAIENFAHLSATNKAIFIGGMAELGEESTLEHQTIAELISRYKWDEVVLVGADFNKIKHPFTYFSTSLDAKEWFKQQKFEHTHILIKGSRSIQMERILQ